MSFRRVTTIVAVLALAVGLSACGSSTKKASADGTTTTTTAAASLQAYRDCMAQNGVTLPENSMGGGRTGMGGQVPPDGATPPADGSGNANGTTDQTRARPTTTLPAGVTQEQYDKARTACQDKMPQRGAGNGQRNGAQSAAYISCLKDHGVTVDATAQNALANVDRNSDTFKAANQTCQALLPKAGASGSTTTTVKS